MPAPVRPWAQSPRLPSCRRSATPEGGTPSHRPTRGTEKWLLTSEARLIGFASLFHWDDMKTFLPKQAADQRRWHVIDADGAVLGRLAVQVADILRGKDKPIYTPHLDAGDFVVVINAEKVRVTGTKETSKLYMSYSGWKGGEKYRSVAQIREK